MDAATRVADAMTAVPRRGFLPRRERGNASYDGPLSIGHGQTNSQPRAVEAMLELLDVRPGQRVLDVGAGSGWTTVLLAHLVGPTGSVVGVELVPEIADFGSANLENAGMPWACLGLARPDVLGSPEDGPFDRILVSAEPMALPESLVARLAPGGVMVIPVAGRMQRVTRVSPAQGERTAYGQGGKDATGEVRVEEFGHYRFVPLISEATTGQS